MTMWNGKPSLKKSPLIAVLAASVPPLVKTISSGSAFRRWATCLRDFSIASLAVRGPVWARWITEAFGEKSGQNFSRFRGDRSRCVEIEVDAPFHEVILEVQSLCHAFQNPVDRVRAIQDVEVNPRDAGFQQALDLFAAVIDSDGDLRLRVVLAAVEGVEQGIRKTSLAERSDALHLIETENRQQAGDDRAFDPAFFAEVAEAEEIVVVVKELGVDRVAADRHFLGEIAKIVFGACRFHVRLGISRDADPELGEFRFEQSHEIDGVSKAAFDRGEVRLTGWRIAAQAP